MRVAIVLGVALVGIVAASTAALEAKDIAPVQRERRVADLLPVVDWGAEVSGSLCGVYGACRALELIGIEADPRQFLASRYVGACGGSTPTEVARIINDAGAKAHILTNLSAFDLKLLDCPIIANVRISPTSHQFNHWVVAVPSDQSVRIYDGFQERYEIETAVFLGNWSAIGICVMRGQNSPSATIWLGRSSLLLAAVIVGVLVLRNGGTVLLVDQPSPSKQLYALSLASVVLSVVGNLVFGDLPNYRKGVAVATAPSQNSPYRVVGLTTLTNGKRTTN
jgi:hypothetical protein